MIGVETVTDGFGIEYTDRARGPSVFPARWLARGVELGDSPEAVSAWIKCNIVEDRALGIDRERRERRRARELAELRLDAARLAVVIERLERRGSQ